MDEDSATKGNDDAKEESPNIFNSDGVESTEMNNENIDDSTVLDDYYGNENAFGLDGPEDALSNPGNNDEVENTELTNGNIENLTITDENSGNENVANLDGQEEAPLIPIDNLTDENLENATILDGDYVSENSANLDEPQLENENDDTHDQGTSPLPSKMEGNFSPAPDKENLDQDVKSQEMQGTDLEENIPIKVAVKRSTTLSAKSSELNVEASDAEIAEEQVEGASTDRKRSMGGNDVAGEHFSMEGMKLPSDISLSTQNSSFSSGPRGSWRTVKTKVVVDGEEKEEILHIFTEKFKKPFLGGFRHRLNNVEYHNASTQTYPKRRVPPSVERYHRDTQTVINRNQSQQTFENTSTQMTKTGCYVSNVTDKVFIPGIYETADERLARRLEKAIILQCHWRRWLATRYVQKLRHDRDVRLEWERQEEIRKQKEREDRIRKEFERRMNPRSKEDFDLLYAALERWRREEIEKIDASKAGPERKAALVGLLEQESYLIASIERHRIKASAENKENSIKKFLDKAASSKKWRWDDGTTMEVDTPYTLRAQELRDLYNSLQMRYLTQDERLDVLLTLKHTVKEHECKLTNEIVELIDRETDFLMRGLKESNLDGLRQRISTLFIQFCKIPLFNPEAARLLKVPQDPSTLRKNVYFCPSCTSYLPSSEFPLASNSRIVGRCHLCAKIDNDARLRQDFSKFRSMLLALRRSEEYFNDGSKIAFIIQEADLRYLVENIWNGQSALSALEDLHELVLVRWNKYEHWSPWNCVLLSKEEAAAHSKLENVNEGYGRIFIGKVHNRHVMAQKHFSKLTEIAEKLHTRADFKLKEKAKNISA